MPQGGAANGEACSARTNHEGGGRDTGGLHRLGHWRSQFATWADSRSGHARERQRHQRDGAADEHVRLRQQSAVDVSRPRHIHHAIRSLLRAAGERVSRSTEKIRVIGHEDNRRI